VAPSQGQLYGCSAKPHFPNAIIEPYATYSSHTDGEVGKAVSEQISPASLKLLGPTTLRVPWGCEGIVRNFHHESIQEVRQQPMTEAKMNNINSRPRPPEDFGSNKFNETIDSQKSLYTKTTPNFFSTLSTLYNVFRGRLLPHPSI
jgi:hypothetical protein